MILYYLHTNFNLGTEMIMMIGTDPNKVGLGTGLTAEITAVKETLNMNIEMKGLDHLRSHALMGIQGLGLVTDTGLGHVTDTGLGHVTDTGLGHVTDAGIDHVTGQQIIISGEEALDPGMYIV